MSAALPAIRLRKDPEYYFRKVRNDVMGLRPSSSCSYLKRSTQPGPRRRGRRLRKTSEPAHGKRFLFNDRTVKRDQVNRLFQGQQEEFDRLVAEKIMDPKDPGSVKEHFAFGAEILVGHLRYSTSGGVTQAFCHPQVRESNWPTKSLMVLGNFNMTNVPALKEQMVKRGQHPFHDTGYPGHPRREIGFHLDEAHTDLPGGTGPGTRRAPHPGIISARFDIPEIIRESARTWDGGYTIVGLVGNGDGFVVRDPHRHPPLLLHRG